MKCYTQENVERLVGVAKEVEHALAEDYRPVANCGYHRDLQDALKPFLTDPEDELVDAMARVDYEHWVNRSWATAHEGSKKPYQESAKKVLNLLKDRGLLKELT